MRTLGKAWSRDCDVVIVGQTPENPRVLGAGAGDEDHREDLGS